MPTRNEHTISIKKTILVHSADTDLTRSISIFLQESFTVVTTQTVEELACQRQNKEIALLVVDVEKNIQQLLEEFRLRAAEQCVAPIIALYAYRQSQPVLEKSLRAFASKVLYKPVPIDFVVNAITSELHLPDYTLLTPVKPIVK